MPFRAGGGSPPSRRWWCQLSGRHPWMKSARQAEPDGRFDTHQLVRANHRNEHYSIYRFRAIRRDRAAFLHHIDPFDGTREQRDIEPIGDRHTVDDEEGDPAARRGAGDAEASPRGVLDDFQSSHPALDDRAHARRNLRAITCIDDTGFRITRQGQRLRESLQW